MATLVSSTQYLRYYVIFINDWTRFTSLYPLKYIFNFYDFFVKFQCLVENYLIRKKKSKFFTVTKGWVYFLNFCESS